MSKAILTDVTKCIGCAQCVIACKAVNNLQPDNPRRWQKDDGLSADNWTSLLRKPDGHYVRKQCRHCLEPACVSACLVGAMRNTEEGIVIYNKSICLGCRYCMIACPYGIPRFDWDEPVPYVRKCIMCYPRVKAGKQPACTEACPTGATIFGERDNLLETAHNRLKKYPNRYIRKIWGEKEIGGTNVLYLSDIDLSFLSYDKELDEKSLPDETKIAMNSVPFVFIGVGALMTGLHLFTRRKNRIAQLKREKEENEDE
ncbi:MAG: 4Fe-4S dicluster domain-containing protein [candidate division Zixibacteria bacterium]|nr:4Fe-4S dicluster domain-containing protein [Candidatus Tariuqbacter arcticus]